MTKAPAAWTVAAALLVASLLAASQAQPRRLGYSAGAFRRERALETQFRNAVSSERLSAFHRSLTRQPHMAGTNGSHVVADSIAAWLRQAGLAVDVYEYDAYLSYPKDIAVEIVAPTAQRLNVTEPASPLDPDTHDSRLGPAFVAYSASGDVTAPVVYANYGLPADYAQLASLGVDVAGKLVIARYGKSHRAVKLFTAQQAGAAGLLLYSDPADDGFARGDTWPRGYWRTSEQIQRGNGKYSWYWHGDPLTPGAPALRGASRVDPDTAPTLPRIPAAVLSWGEARRIFELLDGAAAPASFRGAMPLTYRVGGGTMRVRLRVSMDNGLRPIRDIVARVPGARQPNRGVLLGAHHDAWTFGGVDPGTGTATLLEVARALGALRQTGWRPERTITLAFWDAEEFGLIGSTEYAEQRERELRDGTFCYINTDLYTNGRLDAGGAPSLRDLIVEVAKDVPDGGRTVYGAWRADEQTRRPAMRDSEVELKALGSGADFVPFQDYLGLPSLSIEYNATGGYSYGPYHSNYDTRYFAERVADPGFRRGAQLARVLGTMALRLSESEILPFRFSHLTQRLAEYVAAARGWGADSAGRPSIRLDFAPLESAGAGATAQAKVLEQRVDDRLAKGPVPPSVAATLNDLLGRMEQRLLDEQPPNARWYRNVVYGWDIYSLYDGQPFPGLADAIRRRDAAGAARELTTITAAIERLSQGLSAASAVAATVR